MSQFFNFKWVRDCIMGSAIAPYVYLARWHSSTGWHLAVLPCLWSTVLAAYPLRRAGVLGWSTIFWYLFIYIVGAIVTRGAACTWNDLVDHDIDSQVLRTRSRPLPSGQCTRFQALVFAVLQFLISFVLLLQFNPFVICVGFALLFISLLYPFSKRFILCPQVVLGIGFAGGVFVGWGALHASFSWPAFFLCIGTIFWVVYFDTVYAHQDKKDDELIGVNSTARLFSYQTKLWLFILYGIFVLCFMVAFCLLTVNFFAWIGLLIALFLTIKRIIALDISCSKQCCSFFHSAGVVGILILICLIISLFLDQF
ncbi:4-hydroxybenzoate octaprenyltransferase [Candidatus Liberibacter asiaticus]|uniref:4-hydroxybenzoate octaprenyltransferase n=4 Tax=Liberibacter asiaticus TaxID=34021 RepID=C6XHD5_LIBAP|nr:4-hydroxybenzoate octaprenyltransferase [Candidatus Liberibacter asiaticus]ACT56678.1 prenyltransferase [Candidatus Liberibacter asiaticus str. psy62]AGH16446.1 prenyltransferase [Candidatus Liberibacter asiaticus str. gxpsy]ALK06857.1 4-hydroxybenzoate octaprenyltransferase [Candidatus Liberibacter asiaticus]ASK52325.1 4-hydroxybenzoate octaprenyltransferase [Candidatus Liberibacter asiaticus]AWL13647.1 4-hydroxybenzoate octaprenyltransferase [Candidatus Liberibacter asiaticus]